MDLYLALNQGRDHTPITTADVQHLYRQKQWATIRKHERDTFLEAVLELGWGDPAAAKDKRGWPNSGQDYIHAVRPGHRPIA